MRVQNPNIMKSEQTISIVIITARLTSALMPSVAEVDSSFTEVQPLAYAELHQHYPHEKPQEEPTEIGVGVSIGADIYEFKDIGHSFVVYICYYTGYYCWAAAPAICIAVSTSICFAATLPSRSIT